MRILILDLDTLRPDHLGCYGYCRNTSPNIDRVAAEGVRFDNYYCSDAPCLPSRAALVTGQFGIHSGLVGHGGTAADLRLQGRARGFRSFLDASSLWQVFRRAGLHTASISPFAERHSAFWFDAGLREMHNTGGGGGESAEQVTPTVLKWIDANAASDNWVLHVNYWDPHGFYRAPAAFGNLFAGQPIPGWITPEVLEGHRRHVGPHSAREMGMWDSAPAPWAPRHVPELGTMDDVRRHFDGYDCGIRYMDSHIGQLFDALRARGVFDDLAILITSDHGENQGELGIYMEHATADQATCRIPMIVRWPGGPRGHVDAALHHNLDLAPTLADLLGQKPHPRWDGQSYAPALTSGVEAGKPFLVLSQCAHVCQRGVRFENWLYLRTWHDGFHLFPDEMLFDVVADPHEQHDLAPSNPAALATGRQLLARWTDEMMASQPDGYSVDPMATVLAEGGPYHARGMLKSYCARLEQTGRAHAIDELKRRHPSEF